MIHSKTIPPLHILMVSNLYPPHAEGGAEVVAHRHAGLLRGRGHSVTVFAGRRPSAQIAEGSLEIDWVDGIKVYRMPLGGMGPSDNFHVPIAAERLSSVLMVEKPDIVHFHNLAGLGSSLIPLAGNLGYRTVVTLHDRWGYCYRNTSLRPDGSECNAPHECGSACMSMIKPTNLQITLPMRIRRDYVAWCLESADLLVAPSESLRTAYRDALVGVRNQFIVQSNGIDLKRVRRRKPKVSGRVRFTCVAYLGEHKGIPELLEAATTLARDPVLTGKWSLTLIGDGHLRESVQSAIRSAPLTGAVHYLGRVARERVLDILQETDVVVLPSRWPENEPVSLLEAIASGCAQIATDVGGVSALVEKGEGGELIPRNDPRALAAAMVSYIQDRGKAARHGRHNLRRRTSFCESMAIENLEGWYRQILSETYPSVQSTVVLCGAREPNPLVADVCNSLHKVGLPQRDVRLLWYGWVNERTRHQAKLYWNWNFHCDATIVRQVLRAGVPVLVPRNMRPVMGLSQMFGMAFAYDTYLEAAVILGTLPFDAETLSRLRENTTPAAHFLAQTGSAQSFWLSLPSP